MSKHVHNGISDLRKAGLKRRADAERLLASGDDHTRGAMYLAGYGVECKIKAMALEAHSCLTLDELARKRQVDERAVYGHGLEMLLAEFLPDLQAKFRDSPVSRDFARINGWSPQWRYDPHNPDEASAKAFIEAVTRVCKWLDSNH